MMSIHRAATLMFAKAACETWITFFQVCAVAPKLRNRRTPRDIAESMKPVAKRTPDGDAEGEFVFKKTLHVQPLRHCLRAVPCAGHPVQNTSEADR